MVVPLATISPLNCREHWHTRARRVARERATVRAELAKHDPPSLPLAIELQRFGWNELDDDALPGALKAVRDEIADWLGLPNDRRRPGITWLYSQTIDRSPARRVRDRSGRIRLDRGSVEITIRRGEVTP